MNDFFDKEQRRTIGEVSIDAQLIFNALIQVSPGEQIPYDHLSNIIGRDITLHRSILNTARRMAKREHRMVFDSVRKVGLVRLNDHQIAGIVSDRPMKRIASITRRAKQDIACVDYRSLSNEDKVKLNATQSVLGALGQIAKPKSIEKLCEQTSDPLPMAKTLDFFKKAG